MKLEDFKKVCKSKDKYKQEEKLLTTFNEWIELEKLQEYHIYKNQLLKDFNELLSCFNPLELFEITETSIKEKSYSDFDYYVSYNQEERRLESFDSLDFLENIEDFQEYLKGVTL